MQKRLDGCYTRMLRMALNVSWKEKLTNIELYGQLPPVSSKVAYRRMRIAGHCLRHKEEEASKLSVCKGKGKGEEELYYVCMCIRTGVKLTLFFLNYSYIEELNIV